MRRWFNGPLLVGVLLGGLGILIPAHTAEAQPSGASAGVFNTSGELLGQVIVTTLDPSASGGRSLVKIEAEVAGLPAGFHGFHVHTNGVCEPDAGFTTAGGHLDLGMPDMAGMDMSG